MTTLKILLFAAGFVAVYLHSRFLIKLIPKHWAAQSQDTGSTPD